MISHISEQCDIQEHFSSFLYLLDTSELQTAPKLSWSCALRRLYIVEKAFAQNLKNPLKPYHKKCDMRLMINV